MIESAAYNLIKQEGFQEGIERSVHGRLPGQNQES